jgi:hypothetical protein
MSSSSTSMCVSDCLLLQVVASFSCFHVRSSLSLRHRVEMYGQAKLHASLPLFVIVHAAICLRSGNRQFYFIDFQFRYGSLLERTGEAHGEY